MPAVPIPLHDQPGVYGRLSRLAHWGGALLTLTLLILGLVADEWPEGPRRNSLFGWHVTLGMLALLPLILRVQWRVLAMLGGRSPRPLSPAGWTLLAEKAGHAALLVVLVVMLVSGPFVIWTHGIPIEVRTWFEIPSPMGKNLRLHHYVSVVHALSSKLLIALILVHIAGAVRHGALSFRRMAGRP